ncbi:MAG: CXXX repeat peptide maturase [Muribaculaceae bacterium]|nr:CXXX repeat peptide maturase [Muribaculaceae bacterium]
MLKYLIVQLDDTSTSFCHYVNDRKTPKLIPLEILRRAIIWSMKENLMVQFIYPDYELPEEYKKAIDEIDHVDIISSNNKDISLTKVADIIIFNSINDTGGYKLNENKVYVIRGTFNEIISNKDIIPDILPKATRLNLSITDIPALTPQIETEYAEFLDSLGEKVKEEYGKNHPVQINALTDRIMLDEMNNCNAGFEHITLSPDGNFYICPAFYLNDIQEGICGNLNEGVKIKNENLFKLTYAPICRECDAYQCNRCIWLNQLQTLEVNTPGMQQCVTSHLERNASMKLLAKIRELGEFMPGKEIPEIDSLDPFVKVIKNKY